MEYRNYSPDEDLDDTEVLEEAELEAGDIRDLCGQCLDDCPVLIEGLCTECGPDIGGE